MRGGGGGRGGKSNQPGQFLRKPRWDMNALPKFEKNLYREHPVVQRRSAVSSHIACFMILNNLLLFLRESVAIK